MIHILLLGPRIIHMLLLGPKIIHILLLSPRTIYILLLAPRIIHILLLAPRIYHIFWLAYWPKDNPYFKFRLLFQPVEAWSLKKFQKLICSGREEDILTWCNFYFILFHLGGQLWRLKVLQPPSDRKFSCHWWSDFSWWETGSLFIDFFNVIFVVFERSPQFTHAHDHFSIISRSKLQSISI